MKNECQKGVTEHVLINLVLNAKDTVININNSTIELRANKIFNSINIEVIDNGCGIEQEHVDNIFVPFFTTKKTGSGIGLSLSRQIMRLHGGSILMHSFKGKTIFQLLFPANLYRSPL